MSVSQFTSSVLGKIVANLEGDIIRSSGDLQNDEAAAKLIPRFASLLRTQSTPTKRLSFHYTDHAYVLTQANSHFHLVKVTRAPPSVPHLLDADSPIIA